MVIMLARAVSAPKAPPPAILDKSELERYAGVEEKLAALVRVPTISRFDQADEDDSAFDQFKAELARLYPIVHARLLRTEPGDRAIVFEWPGRSLDRAPVLLTAHFDVVPGGELERW
ncbi:MAG: hypothetical protein E4H20_03415, partial [Spirochaetales bacterium]